MVALTLTLASQASIFAAGSLLTFGDSLTDTTSLLTTSPNYFPGRWSNGKVWEEWLPLLPGQGVTLPNAPATIDSDYRVSPLIEKL